MSRPGSSRIATYSASPRRAAVVAALRREIALLPRLAPLLPAPIPVPLFVGEPRAGFPFPYAGYAILPGAEACDVSLDARERTALALELARFLSALHAVDLDADLPVDATGRADMQRRVPLAREWLERLATAGLWRAPPTVGALLDAAASLPASTAATTVHGDLHFRHVLVDGGRLSGVIDWIDLGRADPAVDLQLIWSFLDDAGRAAFLDTYGSVSDEALIRSKVVALFLAAVLAHYGHEERRPGIAREALAGLKRIASTCP